jgi:hypothetical protein
MMTETNPRRHTDSTSNRGAPNRQGPSIRWTILSQGITDVVVDLQSDRFDGDRFAFEPNVESAESAYRAVSKLRDIYAEGITVYGSDRLNSIRKVVVTDE